MKRCEMILLGIFILSFGIYVRVMSIGYMSNWFIELVEYGSAVIAVFVTMFGILKKDKKN